jgi:hypothetical protein
MNYAPPRQGIPLRANPAAIRERSVSALMRVAVAHARAVFDPIRSPADMAAKLWPRDTDVATILKAATTPTTVAASSALAQTIIFDFIASLAPASAGAQLLAQGLELSFDRKAVINVPGFIADGSNVSFIGEGQPRPMRQLASAAVSLAPRKLSAATSITREQAESSNAEAFLRDALTRSAGLALDRYLFDAQPGDAVRPPGLRNGVAALTASSAADLFEAMVEDVFMLVSAVSTLGPNIALVMSSARAVLLRLRARGGITPTILGSSAIAPPTYSRSMSTRLCRHWTISRNSRRRSKLRRMRIRRRSRSSPPMALSPRRFEVFGRPIRSRCG